MYHCCTVVSFMLSVVMLNAVMLNAVMLSVVYAECCVVCAECHKLVLYAECGYAECCCDECHVC
jgi:hypothetical protein